MSNWTDTLGTIPTECYPNGDTRSVVRATVPRPLSPTLNFNPLTLLGARSFSTSPQAIFSTTILQYRSRISYLHWRGALAECLASALTLVVLAQVAPANRAPGTIDFYLRHSDRHIPMRLHVHMPASETARGAS